MLSQKYDVITAPEYQLLAGVIFKIEGPDTCAQVIPVTCLLEESVADTCTESVVNTRWLTVGDNTNISGGEVWAIHKAGKRIEQNKKSFFILITVLN